MTRHSRSEYLRILSYFLRESTPFIFFRIVDELRMKGMPNISLRKIRHIDFYEEDADAKIARYIVKKVNRSRISPEEVYNILSEFKGIFVCNVAQVDSSHDNL